MSDIAFALNYTHLHQIKIPVLGWTYIGAGIQTVEPNPNETTDDSNYYDGEGLSATIVTGGQVTFAFKGHRKYGDPAQDYIASLMLEYGSSRDVLYRWIGPDGETIEANATIANIKSGGGDANSKGTFEFDVRCNGRPKRIAGDATTFPDSISATAVSVAIDATQAVGAVITPTGASGSLRYVVEDDMIAHVSADGIVTGVKSGTTNLSIKSAVKPSISKEITITVT